MQNCTWDELKIIRAYIFLKPLIKFCDGIFHWPQSQRENAF
jgi:hypothetical protein